MTTTIPRIHIVGRKNAGKTTLVCELIREFTDRGLRIASIKHTHHHHELDTPGKDSYRHRESGAAAVGILSPGTTAIFIPADREAVGQPHEDRYVPFEPMFATCDLILVEGDLQTSAPRLEVWRPETSQTPYCDTDPKIAALISDTPPTNLSIPCCPRSDINAIASEILRLASVLKQSR